MHLPSEIFPLALIVFVLWSTSCKKCFPLLFWKKFAQRLQTAVFFHHLSRGNKKATEENRSRGSPTAKDTANCKQAWMPDHFLSLQVTVYRNSNGVILDQPLVMSCLGKGQSRIIFLAGEDHVLMERKGPGRNPNSLRGFFFLSTLPW